MRIEDLLARMRTDLATLTERRDARRFFHATYLRTTEAVADEITRGGFVDAEWVSAWDLAFAELYLVALDAEARGAKVPGPWRVAFDRDEVFMVTAGEVRITPGGPVIRAGDAVVVAAGSPIRLENPTDVPAEAFIAIRSGFTAIAGDGTAMGTPPWAR